MNKAPLRQALSSMTRSLAEKGDYQPIFQALKSAMPDVAEKHLAACSSDEALAGVTLALGFDDTGDYSTIDHYLTGDAKVALSRVEKLMAIMNRVSAIRR